MNHETFTFSVHSFLSSILPFKPIFLSSPAFLVRPFRFSCCVSTVVFDFPFIFSKDLVMCLVTQSYLTLCDPTDCSLPGSSVHGDSPARILERVAMPSSRGSSQPRDHSGLPQCRQILYRLGHQGSLGYLHIMFMDENDLLFLFSYCLCRVLISKLCTEWVKECFLFVHGLEEFV